MARIGLHSSAAYSFVRFGGGAVAPYLAGKLGERSVHVPFWVGSGAVVLAVLVLLTARHEVQATDHGPGHGSTDSADGRRLADRDLEAEAVTVGDA